MGCPANVRDALATLPWVEAKSIHADRATRQVKFTVTDRDQYQFDTVAATLAEAGYRRARLLTDVTP